VVAVDEAFMDAVPGEIESMISADMTGLVVIRSLTKTWGLAGLRTGYVLGEPAVLSAMAAQQPAWSVSTPALAAIEACLSPQAREAAAISALEIKRRLAAEAHRLYVLDEFTYPINWGWLDIDDVVSTLVARPGRQHVIITGRRADPRLLEVASLVTEMTKIKHPFDGGQKGQRGIEW